jgi:hypothetical protein
MGGAIGGLTNSVAALRGAPGAVRLCQTWLIHARERIEQLDNALAWVDPLATSLLLRELFIVAAAASTALAALAVLPMRQLTRACLCLLVVPAPAATLHLLLSVQRAWGLPERYASGLLFMPEAVGKARGDLTLLDRALLSLRTFAAHRRAQRTARRAAQQAGQQRGRHAERAAPSPPPAAQPAQKSAWMHILDRVPTAERATHMQLNSRALASLPSAVRTRLTVSYNPVVVYGGSCVLQLELWAEDEDVLEAGGGGGGNQSQRVAASGQLELEFIVHLPEGVVPVLLLSPLGALREHAPRVHAALDGCAAPTPLRALPSRREAYDAPASLFQTGAHVQPRWERCGDAGDVDGVCTSLWLKLQCSSAAAAPPPSSSSSSKQSDWVSLGCVPLQFAARPLAVPPPWLQPPRAGSPHDYDVVLSYRSAETGEAGDHFAERLHAALCARAAPGSNGKARVRSFTYASQVAAGRFELSTVFHGVHRCRLFVPICSPTYAHAQLSPGTANELFAAARAALQHGGAPAILPVWHSGVFPPPGAAHVLQHMPRVRVPGRGAAGQQARTPPSSPQTGDGGGGGNSGGGGVDAAAAAAAAAAAEDGLTVMHLHDPVGAAADAIIEALELLHRRKDLKSRFAYL